MGSTQNNFRRIMLNTWPLKDSVSEYPTDHSGRGYFECWKHVFRLLLVVFVIGKFDIFHPDSGFKVLPSVVLFTPGKSTLHYYFCE